MKIAVIGAGSWGTAITSMLAHKNHEVIFWARNDKLIAALSETKENTSYLPGIRLPANIVFTNDFSWTSRHGITLVLNIATSLNIRKIR
jgi:glycerol-3-phosphate dehydrogenase (NAD(P)+)